MMTSKMTARAERKKRAKEKRRAILKRIADIAADVSKEEGYEEAMTAVAQWISEEVAKHPQEKSLYVDAYHEYVRRLRESFLAEEKAMKTFELEYVKL